MTFERYRRSLRLTSSLALILCKTSLCGSPARYTPEGLNEHDQSLFDLDDPYQLGSLQCQYDNDYGLSDLRGWTSTDSYDPMLTSYEPSFDPAETSFMNEYSYPSYLEESTGLEIPPYPDNSQTQGQGTLAGVTLDEDSRTNKPNSEDVPKWYREKSQCDKQIVIGYMCQHWYGNKKTRYRKMTRKHVFKKFTPSEFDLVLQSDGDERILARITDTVKQRFKSRFTPVWALPTFSEASSTSHGQTRSDWMKSIKSKADKAAVIHKMAEKWFESTRKSDIAMARYRIQNYFTAKDFHHVLHSSEYEDGEGIIDEITTRIAEACPVDMIEESLTQQEEEQNNGNEHDKGTWYSRMKRPKDKQYVITRMACLWYNDLYEQSNRERARQNIMKRFSQEDFDLVANPDTPNDILMEISERTKPIAKSEHELEVKAMKKDLLQQGIIQERSLDRYVRDALLNLGYNGKPVEELMKHIMWKLSNRKVRNTNS